jgi:hypothetical protein
MKAEIEEAARHPYTYDPDSPLITEEYLEAQAKKRANLSPEEVERIKAAQKRHSAFDPGCEKLTPEEFINWHPVGGISWEERARLMKERRAIDPVFNALMEEIEREMEATKKEERARTQAVMSTAFD